jgi:hypothetical protein
MDLYHHPDANDAWNDSANAEAEATVAQAGEAAGKEDELEVIWQDVSKISSPKILINLKNGSTNYNRSLLGRIDLIAPYLVLMVTDVTELGVWSMCRDR